MDNNIHIWCTLTTYKHRNNMSTTSVIIIIGSLIAFVTCAFIIYAFIDGAGKANKKMDKEEDKWE